MLMKMGSGTTVRDKQGNTPAEPAEICGNEGTADVLWNKQKG